MEWILLEAGAALLIGIFIAWWLMHGKNESPTRPDDAGKKDGS